MKNNRPVELGLIVRPGDEVPRASSLDIAIKFGKNHRDVLKKIKQLMPLNPPDFNERNFTLVDYQDNKGETRPYFLLTKDAFSLLAMGFTGSVAHRWKLAYIEAFNQQGEFIRKHLLLDGPDAPALIRKILGFARRLTPERKLEIKRAVRYQSLGLTRAEIGRLLGCGPTKAGNLLKEHRWLKGGNLVPGGGQ